MSNYNNFNATPQSNTPVCDKCGTATIIQVVTKATANQGRQYYACPIKCKAFFGGFVDGQKSKNPRTGNLGGYSKNYPNNQNYNGAQQQQPQQQSNFVPRPQSPPPANPSFPGANKRNLDEVPDSSDHKMALGLLKDRLIALEKGRAIDELKYQELQKSLDSLEKLTSKILRVVEVKPKTSPADYKFLSDSPLPCPYGCTKPCRCIKEPLDPKAKWMSVGGPLLNDTSFQDPDKMGSPPKKTLKRLKKKTVVESSEEEEQENAQGE